MNSSMPEMESVKARLRDVWMSGDYGLIAKSIETGAEEFIDRLALGPDTHVLDVACGSGNLTIPAARTGAIVTGVDIATNLLEQGRARAEAEGLSIRFEEGDAEQLPYADASFDVVVSMFGVMFAPNPEAAAAELVRVCRSGGRIALANWTPAGFAGQVFKIVGDHVPPPPGIQPPAQWGEETIVHERLRDGIADLQTKKQICPIKYPFPPSEVVEHFRLYFGPVKNAFGALDAEGQAALRHDLEHLWTTHNHAQDNTTYIEAEYLEVIAKRA